MEDSVSTTCCPPPPDQKLHDKRYRRVLWIVLAINAVMFLVEALAGLAAGSASLQADALNFLAGLAVASIILALQGAWHIALQARNELREI
jgi:Co/Zn/Cd efflux system component